MIDAGWVNPIELLSKHSAPGEAQHMCVLNTNGVEKCHEGLRPLMN